MTSWAYSFSSLDANDYTSGPYYVNFAEGEKIACSEIPVTEDNLDEPDEMFLLQIMPDPEGVPNIMPGPMAQTEVTIKSGKHWQHNRLFSVHRLYLYKAALGNIC